MSGDSYEVGDVDEDAIVVQGTGNRVTVNRYAVGTTPGRPLASLGHGRSLTLLHISDVRFGRNHVFGGAGLTGADQHLDSLFVRLHDDLDHLRKLEGVLPEMVVVSGDLAEWGMASEFEQAQRFLEELATHLDIPRQHLVIVPGNHDVNRKACEAYFNQCAADETDPLAPYWPKWQHFAAMFGRLYASEPGLGSRSSGHGR